MITPLPKKPFGKSLLLQAVTKLMALKHGLCAELSLEASPLLQQGAETAEGQLPVDMSLLLFLLSGQVLGLLLGLFWEAPTLGEQSILSEGFLSTLTSPGWELPSRECPSQPQMR